VEPNGNVVLPIRQGANISQTQQTLVGGSQYEAQNLRGCSQKAICRIPMQGQLTSGKSNLVS